MAFALLLIPDVVFGQCAMCKAVVETSAQSGDDAVEGINNGILYMMGVPYLLLMVVGITWYKKYGKGKTEKV